MYFFQTKKGIDWMNEIFKNDWHTWKSTGDFYNPSTHELIEKKEAKINRLKYEIQNAKSHEQTVKLIIYRYGDDLKETVKLIEKKQNELKQLENE